MSDVTICNLALSHLGDTATVASIDPPESSVQAQLCARFYPVARNALLEMGSWGFATRRVKLALVNANPACPQWRFAYAVPSDAVNVLSVLPAEALNDYTESFPERDRFNDAFPYPQGYVPAPAAALYTPQPYSLETDAQGNELLLADVECAVLRYTVLVTDTTKFSPLFTLALSYLLASMLAGPILKGDAGAAAATQMIALFEKVEGQAEGSDANQRMSHPRVVTPWIAGR